MTFRSEGEDPRQERYAQERFDYTSLFRVWFRAWSDYEVMWSRIMTETPDVHREGPAG